MKLLEKIALEKKENTYFYNSLLNALFPDGTEDEASRGFPVPGQAQGD